MNIIALFLILCVVEILISSKKNIRYRNIDTVAAAVILLVVGFVFDILVAVFGTPYVSAVESLMLFYMVQAGILISVKLSCAKKDKAVKYGIPDKYMSGWRFEFISKFYDIENSGAVAYAKNCTIHFGSVTLGCAVVILSALVNQANAFSSAGNTLMLPFFSGPMVSLLVEFGMFCLGNTRWNKLYSQYRKRQNCSNRRQLAKMRYSSFADFSYIFMKNFVWEPLHIIRATKFKWKKDSFTSSIKYYDFKKNLKEDYVAKEYNPELEEFIKDNNMDVNEMYVAAYNLIDRNQNVLIKTPSYVEFEPYFVAMIKMKVAKTQKVVLVVSNEEKKKLTHEKINNAFREYMGFDEIPLMLTIDECIETIKQRKDNKESNSNNKLSHFSELADKGWVEFEDDNLIPVKSPDIVIAAPEDICAPENAYFLRHVTNNLGLIVYYDFSDCVQEEALFAKIVHSVLDYDDKISTLYMSDSFFDLEQVVDNFFSTRNIYEIKVPRKPSPESFVMGWKAENINEMQSRTNPDASRDVGNHIPILYDAGSCTENDFMIVEDEFDTYAENSLNFSNERVSKRFDYHVGWTNVIGGTSVMCTVSDTYNNVAHTYLAMSGIGTSSEYINIISRPYLLRNYLMYHLRFFTIYPGVLSSYSPGLIKTPRALAYEAVVKLFVVGCTSEQLMRFVEVTSVQCDSTPESMIESLLVCAGCECLETLEITKDIHDRYFINESVYTRVMSDSGLIEKIEFIANRQVIVRNKRDYNYLIPHQKIVLNGVKYTVEKINGNRVELTDSNTREPIYIMRPVRSCRVKVNDVEEYGNHIQNNSNSSISFSRFISDVELETYGNIVFKDSYHPFCDDARYDYHSVAEHHKRSYKNVNVFNINIGSRFVNEENCDRLSHLLALLLNEMLPTFFPRHSKRIIVGCKGWEINSELEEQNVSTLHTVAQMDVDARGIDSDGKISLYILEDSPIETGLVNVFWQDEEFRYMLKVLEDYLYYQKMINRRERKEIFAKRYVNDLSLLKRILLEVINETFEVLGDTGQLEVAFNNKIRTSRNKFNNLELMDNFEITCDFCGKKIIPKSVHSNNYHFYHYSGLVSCMDCFAKAVCSEKHGQADIRAFETLINNWFKQCYKEQVDAEFYNYLEDAERVAELSVVHTPIQDRFIVTDDCEPGGVLGLCPINATYGDDIFVFGNPERIAITENRDNPNKDINDVVRASYLVEDINRSFILIRDGLPYNEYMGTLTHEMTHQWQIANLDIDKLRLNTPTGYMDEFGQIIDLSLYRVEGMAEWERIRYLKHHRAGRLARKEARILRATRNAYGIGYVWMCNMMKVGHDDMSIPAVRTFSFIMKRNFYQFTKNSFALMRLYFGSSSAATSENGEDSETADVSGDSVQNDVEPTEVGGTSSVESASELITDEVNG